MTGVKQFLSGKKANFGAGWMFAGAVAMLMNGAVVTEAGDIVMQGGSGEMAAVLTAFSVALSTLRASIAKIAAQMALPAIAIGFYAVGCATLGETNPNTGNTFSADIQGEILEVSPLFGPVLSTIIPIVTGTGLNLATILGQMFEAKNNPTTPPGPVTS